ncbi:TPA: hypothetical protein RQK50_004447 [Vibrio vulnificus]|nr:hypothetical protein [Vibrio vulnificus]ELI3524711.1 hypothetical protein [Vibrio vulnificus]MBN8110207.1 hypothetical protein [Vibrio vulnificus]HDY7549208.1 hypothetical protein [Vibrio vulnificus]HDY7614604.1 hypothetical protein [Vibrio vulnificus]
MTMAVTVIKDYESRRKLKELHRQVLYRLCFSALVINCTKYVELCSKYSKVFNDEIPHLNKLRNQYQEEIKQRGIVAFRNDYIGHIHSKKLNRPLTDQEVQDKFLTIVGSSNVLEFLDWICPDNLSTTDRTQSLVGVIEMLRDALESKL